MSDMLSIFIKSMLVDNVVFIQYLAICPFIGMTSETGKATGKSINDVFKEIFAYGTY